MLFANDSGLVHKIKARCLDGQEHMSIPMLWGLVPTFISKSKKSAQKAIRPLSSKYFQ